LNTAPAPTFGAAHQHLNTAPAPTFGAAQHTFKAAPPPHTTHAAQQTHAMHIAPTFGAVQNALHTVPSPTFGAAHSTLRAVTPPHPMQAALSHHTHTHALPIYGAAQLQHHGVQPTFHSNQLTFEQQFEQNLQLAREENRGQNANAAHQHFAPAHAYANQPPPPPPNHNLPRYSSYDNPINSNQANSYNFNRGNGFLMSKINLSTYRGKHDKRSPLEYLDLIKNTAISFKLDIFEVVKAKMPLALIEDAKMWWEMSEEYITSWDQFHQDFLNEFATPNFKRNLRRELELRTQHKDEDLTTFIHRIRRYYNLLGQSDNHEEIYERVKNQMHPDYRHYLSGKKIFDLRSLLICAQQVQSEMHTDKNYAPPPGKYDSVEKSLAFYDAKRTKFVPSSNKSSDQSTNSERRSRSEFKSSSQSRDNSEHRSQSRDRSGERARSHSRGSQHDARSSSRDGKRDGQHQRSYSKEKKRDATPHSSHRNSSKN
jgi:Retrotransposon gag protein